MFISSSAIRDVFMGKFCKQLGLSHGMKCAREERINTEDAALGVGSSDLRVGRDSVTF